MPSALRQSRKQHRIRYRSLQTASDALPSRWNTRGQGNALAVRREQGDVVIILAATAQREAKRDRKPDGERGFGAVAAKIVGTSDYSVSCFGYLKGSCRDSMVSSSLAFHRCGVGLPSSSSPPPRATSQTGTRSGRRSTSNLRHFHRVPLRESRSCSRVRPPPLSEPQTRMRQRARKEKKDVTSCIASQGRRPNRRGTRPGTARQ